MYVQEILLKGYEMKDVYKIAYLALSLVVAINVKAAGMGVDDERLSTAPVAADSHELPPPPHAHGGVGIASSSWAKLNAEGRDCLTPLTRAAKGGQLDSVRELLAAGAEVDLKAYDLSALQWAAKEGHPDIVRELLAAGANVNIRHHNKPTALHWAADTNSTIVEVLLAAGADVHALSAQSLTPLILAAAAMNDSLHSTRLLLAAGADVDHVPIYGATTNRIAPALAVANNPDVTIALLEAGADPYVRFGSPESVTIIEYAQHKRQWEKLALIRSYLGWKKRRAAVVACALGFLG